MITSFSLKNTFFPVRKCRFKVSKKFHERKSIIFSAGIYLLKINKGSTSKTSLTSFCCLYCQLWIDFTHCSGVSNVNNKGTRKLRLKILTGVYDGTFLELLADTEAVAQRCSLKKLFVEIFCKIHRKTPVPESLF